jgi:hypothetical protein
MPNRTEARSAKAALTNATGRLPLLRLFSTLLLNDLVRSLLNRPAELMIWPRSEFVSIYATKPCQLECLRYPK